MDKQQQILTAALQLFVNYGFHGTPTSKIAQQAGVANGTLFHYYSTKEDLMISLYNRLKDDQSAGMQNIVHQDGFIADKFRNAFIYAVNWSLTNPEKVFYLQQFNFSPHLLQIPAETLHQQGAALKTLISEGIRKKLFKQIAADLIAVLFNSHVYGTHQYLINSDCPPEEYESIISKAYDMIWDMLKYK